MIKVENLKKCFGTKVLFENLNATFSCGKVYALAGSSGSGKTTLLNIIADLEPFDAGDVICFGNNLKSIGSNNFYRNYLGYIFQNFGLMENGSVRDNLDLGLVGKKLKRSTKEEEMKKVLQEVGLDYVDLDTKIYTLSGGEARRVAIAKTILKNPKVVLCDEPTANLDPDNEMNVINLLLSMKRSDRVIIIASHSLKVREYVDEVFTL